MLHTKHTYRLRGLDLFTHTKEKFMTQFETVAWYVLVAMNIAGVILFLYIGAKLINEAFFKKEEQ
jgi:hypothetical protein